MRKIGDVQELIDIVNGEKKIILYGAGILGQGLFCLLSRMKLENNIIGFAVSSGTDHLDEYMGKQIKCIDEYSLQDVKVLIVVKERYLSTIKENISNQNAFYVGVDVLKKLFESNCEKVIGKNFLSRLSECDLNNEEYVTFCIRQIRRTRLDFEVNIVDHCNLNCQCCNHFSPLASEKYLDFEIFERDLEQIAKLTDGNVGRIWLIGGEPLLHPEIKKFLNYARKKFPNTHITLDTNGTLLLKQNKEFWETLRKTKIEVTLTKYPINIDYNLINKKLELENIEYAYTLSSAVLKTTYHLPLDLKGTQDETESYMKCWHANECVTLKKGRIYTCPIAAHAHYFNEYFKKELYVGNLNSIDIYSVNSIDEILNFIKEPIPFCKHCNIKGYTYDMPWRVSKKEISEWT